MNGDGIEKSIMLKSEIIGIENNMGKRENEKLLNYQILTGTKIENRERLRKDIPNMVKKLLNKEMENAVRIGNNRRINERTNKIEEWKKYRKSALTSWQETYKNKRNAAKKSICQDTKTKNTNR